MDYDLSRIDYAICGITFPDTLKILPVSGPRIQQKFVVGDKNGILQCLGIKDEDPVIQFKTLPGKPITSVQLASSPGSTADKIFVAAGNEVKGYSRKGKVFVTVETALSETITSMCVYGSDLVLGSGRIVTHYRDLTEFHSYNCDHRVLDIAAFAAPNSTRLRLLILLANKGAAILESGQVASSLSISSGPSKLAVSPSQNIADVCAFYGAADGSIGIIVYDGSELSSKCLVDGRDLGSVICLGWFQGSSGVHLAVGRHDGSIQLYLISPESISEKPRLKFTYFCGEPVTSVGGGYIGTEENELLATTFSGRIFALRSRRLISASAALGHIPQDALAARKTKLETEVARLEKQASNEREKYQQNTHALNSGISAPPLLDVQCEMTGTMREGWQQVRVTSAVPLDMLFLYCSRKLDLQTDSAAVLSVCPSQGSANDLLATVRCQAGTRQLWVKARHIRGSSEITSTKLLIYALPAGAPRVARQMAVTLPALPYYSLTEDPEIVEENNRWWCKLNVTGSFSVAEIVSWLLDTFPGDLPKPTANVVFARSHTFLKTILVCRCQRGSAVFKSEDVSAIAVLRNIISNCSIKKNVRTELTCGRRYLLNKKEEKILSIDKLLNTARTFIIPALGYSKVQCSKFGSDISSDCCIRSFELIEELFIKEYKNKKDYSLLKALSALDLDASKIDDESPTVCNDYKCVLKGPTEESELHFDELVDVVEKWYTDWKDLTLHSSDIKSDFVQLGEALQLCKIEDVKNIFTKKLL